MTELERLKQIYTEKYNVAEQYIKEIEDGYKSLIMAAVKNNNIPEDKVRGIYCDIADTTPYRNKGGWSNRYDYIRVDIGDQKDSHELTLYVGADRMDINNCCSGNWTYDSWYYWYVKLMVILSEDSGCFTNYCEMVERGPLVEAREAQRNVSDEEYRIRMEEHERQKRERQNELDNAEYIAHYRKIVWYEDAYVEGQDTFVIDSLYKVVKVANKNFIVNQLYKEYTDNQSTDTWSLRYRDDTRLKKDILYNIGNNYRAVRKEDLNIIE